jgi:hypothetical protein
MYSPLFFLLLKQSVYGARFILLSELTAFVSNHSGNMSGKMSPIYDEEAWNFHIVIIVFQRIIIFLIENIIHRDSFVGRHRLIYIRYCWILSVTFNDMIRDNIGSNRFIYS